MSVRSLYAGFDPTASSLHVGNLLPILALAHSASLGGEPIALIGGATALIGDPTGRKDEKQSLTESVIESNASSISAQIHRIFSSACSFLRHSQASLDKREVEIKLINNVEWSSSTKLIDFLVKVGKHVRVTHMLARDCVQSRLKSESSLTYCELTYQLLQGYDFLHLHSNHGVNVQLGGSDQWGNMVTGLDLIQKLAKGSAACATLPLLQTGDGVKMGKSSGNGVWLDAAHTSVLDFYQAFASLSDEDAMRLLPQLTLYPLAEVTEIVAVHQQDPSQHWAQRRLAFHLVELVHGRDAAVLVDAFSRSVFSFEGFDYSTPGLGGVLGPQRLKSFVFDRPSVSILELLVCVFPETSKSQLKQYIASGAVRLNHHKLDSIQQLVHRDQLGTHMLINLGKHSFYLVQII